MMGKDALKLLALECPTGIGFKYGKALLYFQYM